MAEESRSLKAARYYTGRGFRVVPIPPKTKRPVLSEWQRLELGEPDLPRHFTNGQNIGIINGAPSGGLIDVDLDAPEALAVAADFLPPTGLIHGRPGKPASHCWYLVDPPLETEQFEDPDGTMLVEIRSTGTQTIVPPSVHPGGEPLSWVSHEEAATVAGPLLRGYVARIAACALVARRWPGQGSRHDCALALAGALVRAGWDDEAVGHFLGAVCAAAGDPETRDRLAGVETTIRRLREGGKATGWPTLAEHLGEAVVGRLRDWLEVRSGERAEDVPPRAAERPWPAPIDEAAYHGIAGEVVRLIEPQSEADPVALLVNFLVAAGNCIGRAPHATVGATRHGCNLFAVLVGNTASGRKGTSWDPIQALFELVDQGWATSRIKGGLSSGEGLMHEVRDPVVKDVEIKARGRPTGEMARETIDAGVTDKRLLVLESEYASVLKVMARESNTLSEQIRKAWDIGRLGAMTRSNALAATDTHISILSHVTPDELRRYLSETDSANGFANRYLWICVRRSKLLPTGGEPPDLTGLAGRLVAAIGRARQLGRLVRDAETEAAWAEIYGELTEDRPGLSGAIAARAAPQVLRLSVLYAALDGVDRIGLAHLRAALAVWQYAQASVLYLFGDALGDATADRIQDQLRASPEGLTRTEINDLFGGRRSAAEIQRALGVLVRWDRARLEIEQTKGRSVERWYAVREGA